MWCQTTFRDYSQYLMAVRVDKCSLGLDRIVMTKRKEKIFQIG